MSAEADDHFGWILDFVQLDGPTSSALTRERTSWEPHEADLLTDLEEGGYSDQATAT